MSTGVGVAFCCHGKIDQRQCKRETHLAHTRLRPLQREVRAGSEGRPACYLLTDPGSPDQGLALPIVG